MDELAYAAGIDPIQFRLNHLDPDSQDVDVLRAVAAKAKWEPRRAASRIDRSAPVLKGRGVAYQFRGAHIGAIVTELEVTRKTGKIQLKRAFMAADVGEVINPDTVEAQMQGGILFGITGALWGEITIKGGRVEQTNFGDYRMMRMNEAPAIDVHIIASHEYPGGIGEPGTAAVAPAVANAVFALTGTRVRKLPIEKALAAPSA